MHLLSTSFFKDALDGVQVLLAGAGCREIGAREHRECGAFEWGVVCVCVCVCVVWGEECVTCERGVVV